MQKKAEDIWNKYTEWKLNMWNKNLNMWLEVNIFALCDHQVALFCQVEAKIEHEL